jgi:hypothetical protein
MRGENFIRIIDDVLTHEQCGKLIKAFEDIHKNGGSYTRQKSERTSKGHKADSAINGLDVLYNAVHGDVQEILLLTLNKHVTKYVEDFETGMFGVTEVGEQFPMGPAGVKLQKTLPSEGYHIWHSENSTRDTTNRFIFWILYLNDIDEGGETEFIHLSERVLPKAGRLVIAPAGWTHAHRGNPPLTEAKYVATGWMEYSI